ncbi:MAG: hypothetical protein LBK70_00440 [Clostridiales bacterium]|jgi:hypothetical protein|nr:hypothetical protein [Clostridiales bacterium]
MGIEKTEYPASVLDKEIDSVISSYTRSRRELLEKQRHFYNERIEYLQKCMSVDDVEIVKLEFELFRCEQHQKELNLSQEYYLDEIERVNKELERLEDEDEKD